MDLDMKKATELLKDAKMHTAILKGTHK